MTNRRESLGQRIDANIAKLLECQEEYRTCVRDMLQSFPLGSSQYRLIYDAHMRRMEKFDKLVNSLNRFRDETRDIYSKLIVEK